MATDLEAVAKWHDEEAAWDMPAREYEFHTEAAAAIRAAMGLRELVAKLYCASGCSCCRDVEAWFAAADELAKALCIPRFADDSGWDFWSVREAAKSKVRP
jgi:hypothetical protein